jgi:branched-chain amino acid transport system permease protein
VQSFFQTLISGLSFGAVYALVALGFSLVYRTMGLVNFAHGAVLMIGAYVASTFYLSARLPFAVAGPAAMAVTAAIGLVIERVLRPLENKDFDLMLIGTIGAGTVLEAAAILIWSSSGRGVSSPVQTAPLDVGGVRIPGYNVLVIAVTAPAWRR